MGRLAMASGGTRSEEPAYLTIREARRLLDGGQVSAEELAEAAIERISELDDDIAAFDHVTADIARQSAADFDRRRATGQGPLSALDGIPMSLKDVLVTVGVRTTAGSRHLDNFVPPYDGTVPGKLTVAGAVLLGKTNCDEFAMGSS